VFGLFQGVFGGGASGADQGIGSGIKASGIASGARAAADTGPLHAVLATPIRLQPGPGQAEALFGCGCFWGAEKGFWRLPGVITTAVGYAGGRLNDPSYEQVCSGRTGHAEVVRVVWDTEMVDFSDLLKLFWECHDPTQGDRQGNDRGSQYRSAIYVTGNGQLAQAEASRAAYQSLLSAAGFPAITTEIRRDQTFWFAEPYHQQYLAKPGSRPYCSAQPSGQRLGDFAGAAYRLDQRVWDFYDWTVSHCVLRGENAPIRLA
jgi:peptide-methionine (S)-S-oxide reductase